MPDALGPDAKGGSRGAERRTPWQRIVWHSLIAFAVGTGFVTWGIVAGPTGSPLDRLIGIAVLCTPLILSILDFRRGGTAQASLLAATVAGVLGISLALVVTGQVP